MKTPELSTEHLLQWREASVQWSDPSATQQLPRLNEDRVFTYDPEKLSFSEDPVQHSTRKRLSPQGLPNLVTAGSVPSNRAKEVFDLHEVTRMSQD